MGFAGGARETGNTGRMELHVWGHEELSKTFRELPVAVARKVVAIALMAGASPILQAARANAQTAFEPYTGMTAKSIRAIARSKRGEKYVVIGVLWKRQTFRRTKTGKLRGVGKKKAATTPASELIVRNPGPTSHLIEFGHAGKCGPARPHPFMRPAFDSKVHEAQAIIERRLLEGIDIEAAKHRTAVKQAAGF